MEREQLLRIEEIKDLLETLKDYMDDRADVDYQGDPIRPIMNKEMSFVIQIEEQMEVLEKMFPTENLKEKSV
jgi:hypothetical protein